MVSYNKLSTCCISHEFYKVATNNPNKIAVIQACGGLKIAKEFRFFCRENGDEETREKFQEFISSKRKSVNPPVYEGDQCFTFSDVLSAVDSLSSRLRCILDGGDDPNLVKPTSVNLHQTASDCSSKDQLILESSDRGLEQYTQFHKTYIPRVVGIYMEPSVEYIVSVLSVLRCGEAIMPLDPSWPNERILSVIASSKADLIVGYESSVDRTCHQLDKLRWLIQKGSYPVFYMSIEDFIRKKSDSLLGWPCESERLRSFCYLMYTSGSTGKPKGVCGTEVGLLNRFLWMQGSYPFQKEEILLFKTSISFIDHLQEFLGAILANCTLIIPPFNQLKDNIFCVFNLLQEYSISRLVAVPSLIRAILPALHSMGYPTAQISLKLLVLSGEIFDILLWKMLVKLLPQTSVLNIYGSTEVSGDCTYFDCKWLPTMLEQDALGSVPIGIPIDNCDVVLVGENSPDEGEICVCGSCVASGYFSHPSILPLDNVELHQEIADGKNDENEVYFRTGDFGRKLSDGNLVYIGRKDRTVKISGQRIALEEVESVLREHQEVTDSAVVSRCVQGDILFLEAYLLLKQRENNLEVFRSTIRCWMASKLPPTMIPARFYFVESFPMSSSGKVDYKILATSAASDAGKHIEIEETQDIDLINVIQKAFSDALMVVDKISLDDDFFEMGGNSLLAAHVSYNLGINMKDLYAFPTPLKLQQAIQHKKVSFSRELGADALVGVNSQEQEKSKLPSNKSWMPGVDNCTSLSLTSDYPVKRLKTDSDLYIDPNDANGRDMNSSTSSQVSCSYSRCNKIRHDAGCEGYNCRSVLSWEVPRDKRGFMQERWMVYMESCVDASPLVVFKERNVYLLIGAHSHKFFCIDATSGLVLWEVKLQGRVESSAAILDDFSQVIIGCYDGNIYFLNFSNGIPCWNFQTHGEVKSQPVIDKERHLVWCGSHDHNLYALDYENHCCDYKIQCGGSIFGAPALDEVHEKLYVASTSGRVTALFVGALPFGQLWVQEFGVPIFGSLSINPSSGNVICCMVDGSVVALDTEGSVIWKVSTTGPIFAGPCISRALPLQVLVCSRDGSVYSFNLEKGDLCWKHDVGHPITSSAYVDEHLLLACIDSSLSQRLVCVCSSSGSVHVLQVGLNFDVENQPCDMVREFARFELGGDIFSSPVMIGGEIFVGCRDDNVHCIRLQEEITI
ncbi:putative acyl-activating enzyme 19 isoform X2 [Solanum dulcamara]|uniref:putative acyl-activating enzyme 19 isoform X2 n=1 Tax=Solanum dulcamara TaxID=45834 RepID=UPI002485690B|nr:putative acyl-activating enzyme 19 isoform X2 [Solanum dulcamara]